MIICIIVRKKCNKKMESSVDNTHTRKPKVINCTDLNLKTRENTKPDIVVCTITVLKRKQIIINMVKNVRKYNRNDFSQVSIVTFFVEPLGMCLPWTKVSFSQISTEVISYNEHKGHIALVGRQKLRG